MMAEGLEDEALAELDWEGDQSGGCPVEGHGRNVLEVVEVVIYREFYLGKANDEVKKAMPSSPIVSQSHASPTSPASASSPHQRPLWFLSIR